jgi:DNA-binding response OmpR family regulator
LIDILIVEDNQDLAMGLKNNLEIEGYRVHCAADGAIGLSLLKTHSPMLVILDLMMPNLDGFEFLKRVQRAQPRPMILILSARDSEIDKVNGLKLGADDFMTKPFGLMELIARVEALLRRQAKLSESNFGKNRTRLKVADIEVCLASRQVFKAAQEVELAPKEFDLLVHLLESRGQVLSRLELMKQVWGHLSAVESRTVDTHIGELRRKLESQGSQRQIIKTVRKVGYRIDND